MGNVVLYNRKPNAADHLEVGGKNPNPSPFLQHKAFSEACHVWTCECFYVGIISELQEIWLHEMRILPAVYCNLFKKICLLKSQEALFHHQQKRLTAFFVKRMGNYLSNSQNINIADAVKIIEETISNNCVVIFSKASCPYCRMAMEAFDEINVNYKTIELDQMENGSHLQSALHEMTGARTVPRVFVNGTCIGGGTETRKLNQEGKLLQLVQQCNITAAQS